MELDLAKINSNKKILILLNELGIKPQGAKRWLIDDKQDIVGVLQQNNMPYIFTDKEHQLISPNIKKMKKVDSKASRAASTLKKDNDNKKKIQNRKDKNFLKTSKKK